MTKNQLQKLIDGDATISVDDALRLAFQAGQSHAIGGYGDFIQVHVGENDMVSGLIKLLEVKP